MDTTEDELKEILSDYNYESEAGSVDGAMYYTVENPNGHVNDGWEFYLIDGNMVYIDMQNDVEP